MSTYPTPPPTTSPKDAQNPSSSSYGPQEPAYKITTYKYIPGESAQENHYQGIYSVPSPKLQDFASNSKLPPYESGPHLPPRGRTSPIQVTTNSRPLGGVTYGYNSSAEQPGFSFGYPPPPPAQSIPGAFTQAQSPPPQTQRGFSPPPPAPASVHSSSKKSSSKSKRGRSHPRSQTSSPPRLRSPKPIYYSPTNRIPSPYNTSRPEKRPGFVKRIWERVNEWLHMVFNWAIENPIKAGILSFVPVIAGIGFVKGTRMIGRFLGLGGKKKEGKKVKKQTWAEWATMAEETQGLWGMDHFKGFAGSKAGPLDGALMILRMLMDQWCKLTPSAIPRTASILLQLYFLEPWKYEKGNA